MKVFVAGGTGAIGKPLVPQLVDAGHEVVATTRSARGAETVQELGAEPVIVDGLDEGGMVEAVKRAGPEVVIHEMTALAGKAGPAPLRPHVCEDERASDQGHRQPDSRGARGRRPAGDRAELRRLAERSARAAAVKTEEDPLDPNPPKWMRESMAAFRHIERTVPTAEGLEGVVLRYGGLYGPDTGVMSSEVLELFRKRQFPIVGDGAGVWSFVHVADAASATVAALDNGAPGVYNVVDDDPAPAREWIPYLAEVLGAKPPRRIPAWLGRIVAGEVPVTMMTTIRGSSNAEGKAGLGWQPRYPSWREGVAAEAGAPAGQGTPLKIS